MIMLNVCPCIGFISDKCRVSKKIAENWGTLLISSSNYAKCHLNVCSGGDLCSPFFGQFSETPCMKVGFDSMISLV